ncbi:MAG: SIR2 family NAD-dependent protein deacylase [Halothermotrichaceae bacterium]
MGDRIKNVKTLVSWINEADSAVVLTGAGVSTESGIPDFRSENGIYQKQNAFYVSTLENEYDRFHNFCKTLFGKYDNCKPNKAHRVFSKWEAKGLLDAVITQNIDGLHQQAGSQNVIELHGTMQKASCMDCGKPAQIKDFFERKKCQSCQGKLRPDIVLFGDQLPKEQLNKAFALCQKADLVIVVGTSLEVVPASELPFLSRGRKVLVNKEKLRKERLFDLTLYGSAGDILESVNKEML